MDELIDTILNSDDEKAGNAIEKFVETAEQTFTFPELNNTTKRSKFWCRIYNLANTTTDAKLLKNCFASVRILSREKSQLNELITEEWFNLIKKHTGIGDDTYQFDKIDVSVEAQKALCNVIFNSPVAAAMCCQNRILEGIIQRIQEYQKSIIPDHVKFFDMKILFLITALCPEIRNRVKDELNGIKYLIDLLDLVLKQSAENLPPNSPEIRLTDLQVDLVCEVLKALFNITVTVDKDDEEEIARYSNLVSILKLYLLIPTNSKEKTFILQNNVINLLTNMPNSTYSCLVTPVLPEQKLPNNLRFEDKNMTVIYELLIFLKDRLSDEPTVSKQHEILSPIVSVLLKSATSDRTIRKYLRLRILPPLRDVHNRPEQGTTLRNHLCRLLTTPITQLRSLVAELLFVLCKKSVNRMIKYTGYGNAAGLFAERGLLGGRTDDGEADYSSDSEDSETEEYAEYKHGINPVIGCYEEPHPNVMENMTEEQKEYEAMKLVELIDTLTKTGTIKPCRVGPDGKPQPIEHVLELQEGLKAQQINHQHSDSDSD